MEYKAVTFRKQIEVGETNHEDQITELTKYLDDGYTVINFSCTHNIKSTGNMDATSSIVMPSLILIVYTYLLSKP